MLTNVNRYPLLTTEWGTAHKEANMPQDEHDTSLHDIARIRRRRDCADQWKGFVLLLAAVGLGIALAFCLRWIADTVR